MSSALCPLCNHNKSQKGILVFVEKVRNTNKISNERIRAGFKKHVDYEKISQFDGVVQGCPSIVLQSIEFDNTLESKRLASPTKLVLLGSIVSSPSKNCNTLYWAYLAATLTGGHPLMSSLPLLT